MGAGTSTADADLLAQLTDDGTGDTLPPVSNEPQKFTPAPIDYTPTDHEAYRAKLPGGVNFDPEDASADMIEEHIRILEARNKLKALTDPEQPAAPALSASAAAPVSVTLVEAPTSPTAPGPKLITKVDEHGNEQSLPQAVWNALGAANLAKFTDVPTQPAKPASLI
jgi:hypothetical protein